MVPFSFSPELVKKAIDVFHAEDGLLLSENEARAVLSSLAGLFIAYSGESSAQAA
jgi:hypothetical protein